ncbi:MAG TPA: hypothetical protein VFZ78_05850 [Flavisolibacter sp.]
MKAVRYVLIMSGIIVMASSCNLFKPKYGCGTNGKNVGAERTLEMSKKEQRKAGKFRA